MIGGPSFAVMPAADSGFFFSFGRKMSVFIKSKNRRERCISIEVFGRIINRDKTEQLIFCESVYLKARYGYETGGNMINMTGNVNDKLRKQEVENSVKINKKMNQKPHNKQLINNIINKLACFIL